jgi:hypothetical protein
MVKIITVAKEIQIWEYEAAIKKGKRHVRRLILCLFLKTISIEE